MSRVCFCAVRLIGLLPLYSVVLVVVMACPRPAAADEIQDFERAREAYVENDYATAVKLFEDLVGGESPRLRSRPLVLESRKYLAASYLFQGQQEPAEEQFEQLLRDEPSYQIDPVAFPAAVQRVFSSVKSRLEEERARQEEAQRRAEAERRLGEREQREQDARRMERLRELAASEVVIHERSRWVAFIPFGVGQFQNGHDTLGWAIAVSSALLVGVSVGSFLIHQGLNPANNAEAGLEEASRITNQVSVIALAVLGVASVIDANIRFVPSVREVRPRPLPRDLLDDEQSGSAPEAGVQLSVGLGSLDLRF